MQVPRLPSACEYPEGVEPFHPLAPDVSIATGSTAFKVAESDLAGLESRALKITANRNGMTPKERFLALTMPQEPQAQSQTPATGQAFEKEGKTVAAMKIDGEGRSVIRIHVGLSGVRQRELAKLLERFVAAGYRYSSGDRGASPFFLATSCLRGCSTVLHGAAGSGRSAL